MRAFSTAFQLLVVYSSGFKAWRASMVASRVSLALLGTRFLMAFCRSAMALSASSTVMISCSSRALRAARASWAACQLSSVKASEETLFSTSSAEAIASLTRFTSVNCSWLTASRNSRITALAWVWVAFSSSMISCSLAAAASTAAQSPTRLSLSRLLYMASSSSTCLVSTGITRALMALFSSRVAAAT